MTKSCLFFFIALLFMIIFSIVSHWFIVPDFDAQWYLIAADKLMHGQKFYDDIFEINPPLIILYTMPIVLIAHCLAMNAYAVLAASVYFLMCLLLYVDYKLLCLIFHQRTKKIVYFLFFIALSEFVFSYLAFLEREQLTFVLFLPYLLLIIIDCNQSGLVSKPVRMGVAILAALGLALKPYFLLLCVLLEVYRALKFKKISSFFRIETYSIFSCFLLYLGVVIIFFLDYITKIFPIGSALYVPYYFTHPFLHVFFSFFGLLAWVPILFGSLYLFFIKERVWLTGFLLASLGFFLVAVYAGQIVYYHFYPSIALNTVICASVAFYSYHLLSDINNKKRVFSYVNAIFLLGSIIILFSFLYTILLFNLYQGGRHYTAVSQKVYAQIFSVCSQNVASPTVLTISDEPTATILSAQFQINVTSRFVTTIFFQGLTALEALGQTEKELKYRTEFFRMFNEDIQKRPPNCIVVDQNGYWVYIKSHYVTKNFLPFLLSDPVFRQTFAAFKYRATVGSMKIFLRSPISPKT